MDDRDRDLQFLRRCVELAREALDDGDEPFGSLLVDAEGKVLFEDRNRVKDGDETRHPEFETARWSATHLTASERAGATVYTSGEHCPMCSAAHGWVGLGRDRVRRLLGAAGRVAGGLGSAARTGGRAADRCRRAGRRDARAVRGTGRRLRDLHRRKADR